MFTNEQLNEAFASSITIINFQGGFDSLQFRKLFEGDTEVSAEGKEEILTYLKEKVKKEDELYVRVKDQIDKQEFASDYYQNPYPRTSRGASAPVVYKTIAGFMLVNLTD